MGCASSNIRKKSGQSQTIIFQQTGHNQGQQQFQIIQYTKIAKGSQFLSNGIGERSNQLTFQCTGQGCSPFNYENHIKKEENLLNSSKPINESLEQSYSKKSQYSSKKQSSENSNQQQLRESNSENQLNNNSTYRNISVHEEQKSNPINDEQS